MVKGSYVQTKKATSAPGTLLTLLSLDEEN